MDCPRDTLEKVLLTIDEEATIALGAVGRKLRVVIVGGSAFMLRDLTRRPTTHDIDVLAYDRALADILAQYRMVNSAVTAYMDQIPYNFEDRLEPLGLPTSTVEYLVPSLEDLAVMKLYGWRPNDQEDLTSPAVLERIDWTIMDNLVYGNDEARASALSERAYKEMVAAYEQYARDHGHEANV